MDSHLLIRFLVERGNAGEQTTGQLHAEFESSGCELFDFLAAAGFGDPEEILRFVAAEQGREFIDLSSVEISAPLLASIEADVLRIFECLPLEVSEAKAKVCITDPFDDVAVQELQQILGRRVEVAIADPEKIRTTLSSIASTEAQTDRFGAVSASLESRPETTASAQSNHKNTLSSQLLVALSILAVAATASSALYVSQNRRLEAWAELVSQNETLLRQSDASRKAMETAVIKMKSDIDALERLLNKKEVDAIRIDGFEKVLRELHGKMESLDKILAKVGEPKIAGEGEPQTALGVPQ